MKAAIIEGYQAPIEIGSRAGEAAYERPVRRWPELPRRGNFGSLDGRDAGGLRQAPDVGGISTRDVSMRTDHLRLHPLLEALRSLMPELRERYDVDTLEVFGSRVRCDADVESDIDVLVTFTQTPDLLTFIALEDELSDKLGARVDLVMRRSLKPRLRDRILSEAVLV